MGAFVFQGEYSFKSHFLVASRAIFIESSKENAEGEKEIKGSEQQN
jgi:hypothetical protein